MRHLPTTLGLASLVVFAATLSTATAGSVRAPRVPLMEDMAAARNSVMAQLLGISLTSADVRNANEALVASWRGASDRWEADFTAGTDRLRILSASTEATEEHERAVAFAEARYALLGDLREAAKNNPYARWWLTAYENAIVAPGTPPLTRGVADRRANLRLWVFDTPVSTTQYLEYYAALAATWPRADQRARDDIVQVTQQTDRLAKFDVGTQHLVRAMLRAGMLTDLRRSSASPEASWLLNLYNHEHQPGGPSNPLLIQGRPPLTKEMADAYADYVEWLMGLSLKGFDRQERIALQRILMSEWGSGEGRSAILVDLERWTSAVGHDRAQIAQVLENKGAEYQQALYIRNVSSGEQLLRDARTAEVAANAQHSLEEAQNRQLMMEMTLMQHRMMMNSLHVFGCAAAGGCGY